MIIKIIKPNERVKVATCSSPINENDENKITQTLKQLLRFRLNEVKFLHNYWNIVTLSSRSQLGKAIDT
jgi:hypothetical protein